MLKFLFFSALVLAAVTIGAPILVPLMVLAVVIWVITLPFRLTFWVIGGLIRLPFVILGAIVWGIFRLISPRRRYMAA
jgi:hypothetical protein